MIEHNIDKIVLCGGEPGSNKNYGYPMLSNLFRGSSLGYFFNKIICNIIKMSKVANHIDEQNEMVFKLACQMP